MVIPWLKEAVVVKVNKDMVGCRVLYRLKSDMDSFLSGNAWEGIIQEISPDGLYVKIYHIIPFGGERWHTVDDVEIISVLEKSEVEKEVYL